MLSAVMLMVVMAAPATGLTVTVQLGKPGTTSVASSLDVIEQELISVGLPVRRIDSACEGRRECLQQAAKDASLPAMIAVTIAHGKKMTTFDLEAIRASDGAAVAQSTFAVSGRLDVAERAEVHRLGVALVNALKEAEPDAPVAEVKPVLVPEPVVSQPVTIARAEPRSRVPGFVFLGAGVASAAVSGVFLGLGVTTRSALEMTPNPSPLTRSMATQMASDANRDFSIALATGILAGALVTTALLWLFLPSP